MQTAEEDPAERLRETERQRRRRLPRTRDAGLHHTASYSHSAPAVSGFVLAVSGVSRPQVADWKANTEYKGLRPSDPLVKWFWQLLESWGPVRRSEVLQLATGTAAAPKAGFGYLSGHDIRRPDGAQKFSLVCLILHLSRCVGSCLGTYLTASNTAQNGYTQASSPGEGQATAARLRPTESAVPSGVQVEAGARERARGGGATHVARQD